MENNEQPMVYGEDTPPKPLADDDSFTTNIDIVSQSEIVIVYTNNTNEEFTYGKAYEIEQLEDGVWSAVPSLPGIIWNDVAYAVGAGQSVTETIDLMHDFGGLSVGHYRITRDFHTDSLKFTSIAEFDIVG
jgi:hypothetical protein